MTVIMMQKGMIRKLRKDGEAGYILSTKGKDLVNQPQYMKYHELLDDDKRQYEIRRRYRKRQYAKLYALFDRTAITYEIDRKPPISKAAVMNNEVFFYAALDFKRALEIDSSLIKGSRVLGFLIGKGLILPVYRTNQLLKSFGSHETLVPEYIRRYFHIFADSAVLVCSDREAVVDISNQLIRSISYDKKDSSMNTAQYNRFYVLPSDDTFLSHFNDLYADHSGTEQRIIREYNIDISDTDNYGRPRLITGTGVVGDFPVLVHAGNVDVVSLKMFILDAEICSQDSYIFCRERDAEALKKITKGTPVRVITI